MWSGVRPIIFLASMPTASGRPSRAFTATTDGSSSTTPRPRTYTSVLAVPRSTAMSRPMKLFAMPREPSQVGWNGGKWGQHSRRPTLRLRSAGRSSRQDTRGAGGTGVNGLPGGAAADDLRAELGEPDADLPGGGLGGVGAVDQVL